MNQRPPSSGIRRVLSDFMELVELQCQLVALDGKEAMRRTLFAALMIGIAAVVALSAVTVGLLGFGWMLHEWAGWPVGVSLLVMSAVGIVVTLAVLVGAYASLRRAAAAMRESGAEFAENARWFRETVRADPEPYAAAGRARF